MAQVDINNLIDSFKILEKTIEPSRLQRMVASVKNFQHTFGKEIETLTKENTENVEKLERIFSNFTDEKKVKKSKKIIKSLSNIVKDIKKLDKVSGESIKTLSESMDNISDKAKVLRFRWGIKRISKIVGNIKKLDEISGESIKTLSGSMDNISNPIKVFKFKHGIKSISKIVGNIEILNKVSGENIKTLSESMDNISNPIKVFGFKHGIKRIIKITKDIEKLNKTSFEPIKILSESIDKLSNPLKVMSAKWAIKSFSKITNDIDKLNIVEKLSGVSEIIDSLANPFKIAMVKLSMKILGKQPIIQKPVKQKATEEEIIPPTFIKPKAQEQETFTTKTVKKDESDKKQPQPTKEVEKTTVETVKIETLNQQTTIINNEVRTEETIDIKETISVLKTGIETFTKLIKSGIEKLDKVVNKEKKVTSDDSKQLPLIKSLFNSFYDRLDGQIDIIRDRLNTVEGQNYTIIKLTERVGLGVIENTGLLNEIKYKLGIEESPVIVTPTAAPKKEGGGLLGLLAGLPLLWKVAKKWLKDKFKIFVGTLGKVFSKSFATLNKIFLGSWTILKKIFSGSWEKLTKILTGVKDFFLKSDIIQKIKNLPKVVGTIIQNIPKTIRNLLLGAGKKLGLVGEFVIKIKDKLFGAGKKTVGVVGEFVTKIKDKIFGSGKTAGLIGTFVTKIKDKILGTGKNAGLIGTVVTTIKDKILGAKGIIVEFAEKAKTSVLNTAKTIGDTVLNFIKKGIKGLLDFGGKAKDAAKSAVTNVIGKGKDIASKGSEFFSNVWKKGKEIGGGIVTKVDEAKNIFKKFGSSKIISSIIPKIMKFASKIPILNSLLALYSARKTNKRIMDMKEKGMSNRDIALEEIPRAGGTIGSLLGGTLLGTPVPIAGHIIGGLAGDYLGKTIAKSYAPEIADKLSEFGAASLAKKETPMAKGGIVTKPTRALIGEAGPEAVIPLKNMESFATLISKKIIKNLPNVPVTKKTAVDITKGIPKKETINSVDNLTNITRNISEQSPSKDASIIKREERLMTSNQIANINVMGGGQQQSKVVPKSSPTMLSSEDSGHAQMAYNVRYGV